MEDINKEILHMTKMITYLRQRKSLTQNELGDLMGVTKQSVSRYEKGIIMLSVDKLLWYQHYFNIPLHEMFGLKNALSKEEKELIDWYRSAPTIIKMLVQYMCKYKF